MSAGDPAHEPCSVPSPAPSDEAVRNIRRTSQVGIDIGADGRDTAPVPEAPPGVLQAARLAAIGQVATGLAHESRNALQRSQACLSILMLRLKDQPEILERDQSPAGGSRGADLGAPGR